jgi:hypothetical protein
VGVGHERGSGKLMRQSSLADSRSAALPTFPAKAGIQGRK